jgi:hypothetical protein
MNPALLYVIEILFWGSVVLAIGLWLAVSASGKE